MVRKRPKAWQLILVIGLVDVVILAGVLYFLTQPAGQGFVNLLPTPDSGLRGPAQVKLDTVFLDILDTYRSSGQDAAIQLARQRGVLTPDNQVRMTLVLSTTDNSAIVAALTQYNIKVENAYENRVAIAVPFEVLTSFTSGPTPSFTGLIGAANEIVAVEAPRPIITDQ